MQKTNFKKIELLAPAGSYDSFIAAVNAGADAVYMGLKDFNARVMTNNFDLPEYTAAIDYAHKRDVKVYLTLNTLLLDNEMNKAINSVYELYKYGLDGVIVQDLGVADIIHKLMPELSLHASTQMSICTIEQVKILENLGFERVVLARELSIDEIKKIAEQTKLEIEVFVHGALCVSVSGQCLMSAMIGNRSANRGSCAGPCRKKYSLYTQNGKQIEKNKYLLSKKDIFALDKLQDLIDAGVYSLKIEGRNKTPEYVAGVVRNYRQTLDDKTTKNKEQEVLQLFNRSGKSDGYLNGVRYRNSISEFSPKNTGMYLGKVIDKKDRYIKVKLEENIDLHDGIETIGDKVVSTIVTCIRDSKYNIVNDKVAKGSIVWLGDVHGVNVGDSIYKTSSNKLNTELSKYAKANLRRKEYTATVCIKENEKINAYVGNIKAMLDYMPEISKTSSVNEEKIKEAFSKTEETSVKFDIVCDVQEGLFVPTSKLNELRKLLVEKIEETKVIRKEIKDISKKIEEVLKIENKTEKNTNTKIKNSLYVYKYNQSIDYINYYENKYSKKLDVLYINATDFNKYEKDILKYVGKCNVYFIIPNITLKNTTKYIESNLEILCKKGIKGILLGNIGFLPLCSKLKAKYNLEIVGDYSLNVINKYSVSVYKELGMDKITPLFENDDIDLESLNKILPIELVQDMATVMTTRYCVIASFAKDVHEKGKCNAECTKNDYYLIDELNKRYDILTDPLDCITRYVRNKRQYAKEYENIYSTRHCVLK